MKTFKVHLITGESRDIEADRYDTGDGWYRFHRGSQTVAAYPSSLKVEEVEAIDPEDMEGVEGEP